MHTQKIRNDLTGELLLHSIDSEVIVDRNPTTFEVISVLFFFFRIVGKEIDFSATAKFPFGMYETRSC